MDSSGQTEGFSIFLQMKGWQLVLLLAFPAEM